MKAKSYGLTDLAQLQKDLKKQAEARAQAEKQAREQRALEQRINSEFLNEVRGVTPIKQKDRYIHPTRDLPEPTVRVHSDHEEQHAQQRQQHNRKSDQFDARHLRDDENGTYLRKGIPEALLKKLQKGAWPISSRIDLHGKTVEEAVDTINAMTVDAFYRDLATRLPARETRFYVARVQRMKAQYASLR